MQGRIERKWRLRTPDPTAVAQLADALALDPLTAALLVNRSLTDPEEARRFLSPRMADMPDPYLMKDMEKAVTRIIAAMDGGESICVWGDYDVDGVTSATQLLWFFRYMGVEVRYFVPDRFEDGYGLNAKRVRELAKSGIDLLITVDCGISNAKEVEVAREEGTDVVVVDHHQVPENVPRAVAVLNPHQSDCPFPDDRLAACGVTWVLLVALRKRLRELGRFGSALKEPDLRTWLDLTAIGTVADLVQLKGLNRTIVRYGLLQIANTRRPGVKALCDVSKLEPHRITAGRIGFQLGPRINAAGRVAHASAGVELLATEDFETARATAEQVDAFNAERRGIQDVIFEQAVALAEADGDPKERASIVIAQQGWHPGVLGIVASKLVDRYYRPTILMAIEDGVAKGSARSISGFKLVAHLDELADMLDKYGGHDHAAGLSLQADGVQAFRDALEARARAALSVDKLTPSLNIDAEVRLGKVPFGVLDAVKRLEPYGMGNPEPTLMATGVTVLEARLVGADQTHLKLTLEQDGVSIDAIAFSMGHLKPEPRALVDIVYRPEINVFRGNEKLQLQVKALRPSQAET